MNKKGQFFALFIGVIIFIFFVSLLGNDPKDCAGLLPDEFGATASILSYSQDHTPEECILFCRDLNFCHSVWGNMTWAEKKCLERCVYND